MWRLETKSSNITIKGHTFSVYIECFANGVYVQVNKTYTYNYYICKLIVFLWFVISQSVPLPFNSLFLQFILKSFWDNFHSFAPHHLPPHISVMISSFVAMTWRQTTCTHTWNEIPYWRGPVLNSKLISANQKRARLATKCCTGRHHGALSRRETWWRAIPTSRAGMAFKEEKNPHYSYFSILSNTAIISSMLSLIFIYNEKKIGTPPQWQNKI